MEKSIGAPFLVPSRRSHLPSRTYRSLVRICSGFNSESRVSLATPTVLQELRSDNNADKEASQISPRETSKPRENLPPCTEPENPSMKESKISQKESDARPGCEDGGSGESITVLNDTESVLADTTYQENSLMDDHSQKLMDELERLINGGEDLVPEDCMNLQESLDMCGNDIDLAAPIEENAKESRDPVENVVKNPSIATELQRNQIPSDENTSELVEQVSKTKDCKEDKSSEVHKAELEKSACNNHGLMTLASQRVEDEALKGEVSGDMKHNEDDDMVNNGGSSKKKMTASLEKSKAKRKKKPAEESGLLGVKRQKVRPVTTKPKQGPMQSLDDLSGSHSKAKPKTRRASLSTPQTANKQTEAVSATKPPLPRQKPLSTKKSPHMEAASSPSSIPNQTSQQQRSRLLPSPPKGINSQNPCANGQRTPTLTSNPQTHKSLISSLKRAAELESSKIVKHETDSLRNNAAKILELLSNFTRKN